MVSIGILCRISPAAQQVPICFLQTKVPSGTACVFTFRTSRHPVRIWWSNNKKGKLSTLLLHLVGNGGAGIGWLDYICLRLASWKADSDRSCLQEVCQEVLLWAPPEERKGRKQHIPQPVAWYSWGVPLGLPQGRARRLGFYSSGGSVIGFGYLWKGAWP